MNVHQAVTSEAIKTAVQQSVPILHTGEAGQNPDHHHQVECAQVRLIQEIAFYETRLHIWKLARLLSRVRNCIRVDINPDSFDATACKPQGGSPTVAANLQGSLSAV